MSDKFDNFQYLQELAYYDGPLIFTAKDKEGQLYFVLATVEEYYFFVPVSEERLQSILDNKLELRKAVIEAEGGIVYRVRLKLDLRPPPYTELKCSELTDDMLPEAGCFLHP